MNKWYIFDDGNPEQSNFDYEIGEIITFNSNKKAKCINITKEDNNIYYHFKIAKIIYDFS